MVDARTPGKSLVDYLIIARRYWVLIVVAVIAAATAGVGLYGTHKPQYSAQARVYIAVNVARPSINDLSAANVLAQSAVLSYAQVASSSLVLSPVISSLRLSDTVDQLAGRTAISVVPNTVVMVIGVTDDSPAQAARIANEIADQLAKVTPALSGASSTSGGTTSVDVSMLQPATADARPTGAGLSTYVGVAVLVSFVLVVLLIALLEGTAAARRRPRLERFTTD